MLVILKSSGTTGSKLSTVGEGTSSSFMSTSIDFWGPSWTAPPLILRFFKRLFAGDKIPYLS